MRSRRLRGKLEVEVGEVEEMEKKEKRKEGEV